MSHGELEDEVRRLRERVSELERVVERDLGVSVGPVRLPQEPQTVECEACEKEFDVDIKNGLVCPHCGTTQSDEPEMAADGGQPTDALTEELPDEVLDRMQSYQQDDETIEETLERVVNAFVPHAIDVDEADSLEPGSVDGDTRFIHQRWPDLDDYMGSHLYTTPGEFVRAFDAAWEGEVSN